MDDNVYSDPIIAKYAATIRAANPAFKHIFQGDPIRIPASMLPCVVIAKRETRVGFHTNAEDEHGVQMVITLVADIRKDLSEDKKIVAGIGLLYDLVEGRNSDYTLKASSLLGILRKNQVLDAANNLRTDLTTITRVNYGMAQNRDPEAWSIEAEIEFIAHFTQIRTA